MRFELELGESADPRALVRGDPAAVGAAVEHLASVAARCGATAEGLDDLGVRGWSGAAASAYRSRHAELVARWSGAAAAFRAAAEAWRRFGVELVAAQEVAAAAVARFSAAVAEPGLVGVSRLVAGQGPAVAAEAATGSGMVGKAAVAAAVGSAVGSPMPPGLALVEEVEAARRMLAEARGRRDRAAEVAAREIAAAAASAPDPPSAVERRAVGAADWVRANGAALGHVAQGVGEGVEDVVRFARLVNPADPYNLNHPGRFLANASTALAGAVDDVVHPLRQLAGIVGPGWGSDPARAYGHLLPSALLMATAGAGRPAVRAPDLPPAPLPGAPGGAALPTGPHPTARPFTPAADAAAAESAAPPAAPRGVAEGGPSAASNSAQARAGALAAADAQAAGRLAEVAHRLPSDPAKLMPQEVAEPGPHHDPERARRARVTRADKDFTSTRASRGNRKSHLDEHGRLVPANPAGAASIVEHVLGRRSRTKADSPYSSFTAPGARAAVDFGGSVIEVDVVRLQADIDAGRVPDVEILPPHRVQAAIQADADRIAGGPVDLYVRKGRIAEAARSYGLDAEATAALRQRMIDMANAQRHHEWMIRGIVPSRYIVGPHPGRSDG